MVIQTTTTAAPVQPNNDARLRQVHPALPRLTQLSEFGLIPSLSNDEKAAYVDVLKGIHQDVVLGDPSLYKAFKALVRNR